MIRLERLVLKPFEDKDVDRLVELLKNEEIKETYMIPSFDDENKYLKLAQHFLTLSHDENHYVVGINLNNVLIGFINDVEIKNGTIELGYVIDPIYKNKGYCTEALRGSINYLFKKGYVEIVCGAFTNNIPSIRVMEKAGLILLNRMDKVSYKGIERDCIYYSIFKGME